MTTSPARKGELPDNSRHFVLKRITARFSRSQKASHRAQRRGTPSRTLYRRSPGSSIERLEARLPLAGDLYVDDDWVTLDPMDDPPGPATSFGHDAFATIAEAITAASPDDNIHIAAGNYVENLVVDKPLALFGESESSTFVDASGGERGIDITTGGDNVTIQDLAIQDAQTTGINAFDVSGLQITSVTTSGSGPSLIGTAPNREYVGNGIHLNQVTNSIVTNITSTNNGGQQLLNPDTGITSDIGAGIAISDSMTVTVRTTTLTGNGLAGLGLFATGERKGRLPAIREFSWMAPLRWIRPSAVRLGF